MKVLLTHERFPPDFAGGGEVVALETARHLITRGVDVRVLTTGDPRTTSYETIPTKRLRLTRYRLNLAVREIEREARDADMIHTFTYHACIPSFLAGRRLSKPVVCTVLALFGDSWRSMRGPILGRCWQACERVLLSRPFAHTFFLSERSREEGVALGVARARSSVSMPGLDCALYDATRPKDPVVLVVGYLGGTRKGIPEIMQAAHLLPDIPFRLVGWGAPASLRVNAPPNVEILELERGLALREHFARASIFALPSHAETFGVAVLEAMASACAIVSTAPLPFEGEHIRAGDTKTLTAAVDRLWRKPDEARRAGLRNAEIAREFTWARYTDVVVDGYRTALLRDEMENSRVD